MTWDLRPGPWQTAVIDVTAVDVLLCDPPYSDRTHQGQRTGSSVAETTIRYDCMTEDLACELAASWAPRTRWWAVVFGDHVAFRMHEAAWSALGWYTFAPVIWLPAAPPPRLQGDGPACAAEHIMVARPRHRLPTERTGSRPGRYAAKSIESTGVAGHKALDGIRALVRDYTLPGDLVADPYAGLGTTLLAAAIERRNSVGAEVDATTFQQARRRLVGGHTGELFAV